MVTIYGDLWKEFEKQPDAYLVIPTNIGWKADGSNVMGKGVAKAAAEKYPELPGCYGTWCEKYRTELYVHVGRNVICAPTKPLNPDHPNLSWKNRAKVWLVKESYRQLNELARRKGWIIYTPLLGAGNGGLRYETAVKLIREVGMPDNVILVLLEDISVFLDGEISRELRKVG